MFQDFLQGLPVKFSCIRYANCYGFDIFVGVVGYEHNNDSSCYNIDRFICYLIFEVQMFQYFGRSETIWFFFITEFSVYKLIDAKYCGLYLYQTVK
jgi:hypothetical protein